MEGMQDSRLIPDSSIMTIPTSVNVGSLRPNSDSLWSAPKDLNPEIIIKLAEEPIRVERLEIDGNIAKLTVGYKRSSGLDSEFIEIQSDNGLEPEVNTKQDEGIFSTNSCIYRSSPPMYWAQ